MSRHENAFWDRERRPGILGLVDDLYDDNKRTRLYGLRGLKALGPRAANEVSHVARLLNDPSAEVRGTVPDVLIAMGQEAAEYVFTGYFQKKIPSQVVRLVALGIGPKAIPLLEKEAAQGIKADSYNEATFIVRLFVAFGAPAADSLVTLISSNIRHLTEQAAAGLKELGPLAFDAVHRRLLASERTAAETLGEVLGSCGLQALPVLLDLLQPPSSISHLESAACKGLEEFRRASNEKLGDECPAEFEALLSKCLRLLGLPREWYTRGTIAWLTGELAKHADRDQIDRIDSALLLAQHAEITHGEDETLLGHYRIAAAKIEARRAALRLSK